MNSTHLTNNDALFISLNGKEVTTGYLLNNVAGIIVGLFSFGSNTLVLDTLVREHEITPQYLIICNLAVTDMLTGLLAVLWGTQQIVYYQLLEEHLLRIGASMTFVQCSLCHIVLIIGDAYIKIVHPYRYFDLVTKRAIAVTSGVIWTASVLYGLVPILGWRNETSYYSYATLLPHGCLIMSSILFCMPMVAAFPCIVSLVRTSARHARAIESQTNRWFAEPRSCTLKSAKTASIISLAYFVCVTPMVMAIILLVSGVFENLDAEQIEFVMVFFALPLFCNPIFNVIIYSLRLTPIKKRLQRMRRAVRVDQVTAMN